MAELKKLQKIQEWATIVIEREGKNLAMMKAVDRMWEMEWSLPDDLDDIDWIRKTVSSDPHDAIRTGTRVLSTIQPRLKVIPLGVDPDTQALADRNERAMIWFFNLAQKRYRGNLLQDLVKQALKYDRVCCQATLVSEQNKGTDALENRRKKASEKFGPYMITLKDPRNTFVEYSGSMIERVINRQAQTVQDVIDFWGTKASGLKLDQDKYTDSVTIYDYQDYTQRTVWAERTRVPDGAEIQQPSSSNMPDTPMGGDVIILNEETETDFLPWVYAEGGDELIPMLYSVYKAKQYDDQCVMDTLYMSEAVAHAAAPRNKVETDYDSDDTLRVQFDYGNPGRIAYVPAGMKMDALNPPPIDNALKEISEKIEARIEKSTVPAVIQSGAIPSGTAYSTLNLATQSGVKSLAPYKKLAEKALEGIFSLMFYWIDYAKVELEAFPIALGAEGKMGARENVTITRDDFDVDHLYLEVELDTDVPTDRLQRINGAKLAKELKMSDRTAQETMGIADSAAEIEQYYNENQRQHAENILLERMTFQEGMQQEMAKFKMSMVQEVERFKMMSAMEQSQNPQPPPEPQKQLPPGSENVPGQSQQALRNPGVQQQFTQQRKTGQGFENLGGQGFNNEMGGTAPIQGNPGGTKETQQFNKGGE